MKAAALPILSALALVAAPYGRAAEPLVTEVFINAPVGEVWRTFTTAEGYRATGAAEAEVDLRLGGHIRAHYGPEGRLGDEETVVREILAYEPERMLALRLVQAPAGFPYRDAIGDVWTVIYFTAAGENMTQVRVVGLGFADGPQSQALRRAFEEDTRALLDRIAKRYWPKCARCEREASEAATE
ncbi:MAG TPA: SRPBCC domain-containing protein [Steroidobacter sp.]